MIALLWIYYSAQIVFFGAEFTQVYSKQRAEVRDTEAVEPAQGKTDDQLTDTINRPAPVIMTPPLPIASPSVSRAIERRTAGLMRAAMAIGAAIGAVAGLIAGPNKNRRRCRK